MEQIKSFTLIELLIVIAIIGILTGILIVSMTSATNSANDARRKADINQLVKAITIIKTTDGSLPTETNANCKLGSTNSSENCSGIEAKLTAQGIAIPKDPVSGNYYIYNRVSADDFTISASMSDNSNYSYSSASSKYSSSSLLTGWTKRKPITITNTSGSTLTDYQISLDIAYDSDMQADFDDIRFTDSNASLLLSYWIESKTDSSTAKVWVKIPSIPTSGTTVYLYYGNSSAVSTANGDNTFAFFDDFSSSSLDSSKWTINGTGLSLSQSVLTITSATYISSKTNFGTGYSVRSRGQFNSTSYASIGFHSQQGVTPAYGALFKYNYPTGNVLNALHRNPDPTNTGVNLGSYSGSYKIFEVKRNGASSCLYVINDAAVTTITTNVPTVSIPAYLDADGTPTHTLDVDWIFVRSYLPSEPSSVFGTEEGV
ncbi:DUF2341 domain-containing protein [bacterium]|nr:DUF2341 domain-containing protein [bacterium]